MGGAEVEAFLSYLAVKGKVSASTQNQAKSAILFLYRHVLEADLPWLEGVVQAEPSAFSGARLHGIRCDVHSRGLCASFQLVPWWPGPVSGLRSRPRGTRLLGAIIWNNQLSPGEQVERDLGGRNHPRCASDRR